MIVLLGAVFAWPLLSNHALPQVVVMATDADPLIWLFNLGTAGVWLVCYMTGLVHGKPEVDFLKKQIEDREKQIDKRDQLIEALREQLTNRTIPALARLADVAADYPPPRPRRERETQDRLEELLERVARALPDEKA